MTQIERITKMETILDESLKALTEFAIALEKFKSLFQQVIKPAKFGNVSPAGVLLDLGALFKSARQFQQTVLD